MNERSDGMSETCPKCGADKSCRLGDQTFYKCRSYTMPSSGLVVSYDCLRNQLAAKDAENIRMREALADIARHPNAVFNVAKCDSSEPTIEQMARAALEPTP